MSVTSSYPCIKIPPCSTSSSCSSSSTSSYNSFRFSSCKPYAALVTIRNSQTEGPLRRPVVREPSSVPQPQKPSPPSQPQPPPPPPQATVAPPSQKAGSAAVGYDKNAVTTIEFQRQKAKELQEYFKQKKLEEASQGPAFGFVGKNEIGNGRWAMFGFAVGMLTEYATGSDFVDQVKILLSNFGIVDLE